MPTNKQRREAARRHLERQLQRRQERDAARKRFTLIASVVGTLVVIVVLIVVITMAGSDKKKPAAAASSSPSAPVSSTSSAPSNGCGTLGSKPKPSATGAGTAVSFDGVTVKGATNYAKNPSVGSSATAPPSKLLVKDLIVGTGKTAKTSSTVSVQYTGVLYCDGTEFDGPTEHGNAPISFSLAQVIPGFTQGIGGTTGISPMKVGGRRLMIIPSALGYGSQATGQIPANSPLVFVVDLKSVK